MNILKTEITGTVEKHSISVIKKHYKMVNHKIQFLLVEKNRLMMEK